MTTARSVNYGDYGLAVSSHDRAAGLLVTLLIIVGTTVFCLLVIWLTSQIFIRPAPVPVIVESIGGRGDSPLGLSQEIDPPGVEELPDLVMPQLQQTLATVMESARVASVVDETLDAVQSGPRAGTGDNRRAGVTGPGDGPGIPRHLRWEIVYESGSTLDAYARALDEFGIELGVLESDGQVTYVGELSSEKPNVRTSGTSGEQRLHFAWKKSPRQQADQELLKKAGVAWNGRPILQFIPADVENQMANLERIKADGRPVERIRKTIFGVRQQGQTHAFYVIKQMYR